MLHQTFGVSHYPATNMTLPLVRIAYIQEKSFLFCSVPFPTVPLYPVSLWCCFQFFSISSHSVSSPPVPFWIGHIHSAMSAKIKRLYNKTKTMHKLQSMFIVNKGYNDSCFTTSGSGQLAIIEEAVIIKRFQVITQDNVVMYTRSKTIRLWHHAAWQ